MTDFQSGLFIGLTVAAGFALLAFAAWLDYIQKE